MGVKVYCGSDFEEYGHEWKQFKELVNVIKLEYQNNSNEDVYILGNIFVEDRYLDVIIIKKQGFAIVDLKSYEGKIIGSENGDWFAIESDSNEKKIHRNVFEQLFENKMKLTRQLKSISNLYFPLIKKKKLNFIKCWGYFEKNSSYCTEQIARNNRRWFNVITKNTILEELRFLKCGYTLTRRNIEDLLSHFKLKQCRGLTVDGEDYYIQKILEAESVITVNSREKLTSWVETNINNEFFKIVSFITRTEVKYHPLYIEKLEDISTTTSFTIGNAKNISEALTKLKAKESNFYFLLGKPGSGKTSILKEFYLQGLKSYLASSINRFPVLVQLSKLTDYKDMNQFLAEEYTPIYKEIKHILEAGKAIVIIDAWDELKPNLRKSIEDFVAFCFEKSNSIYISSRYINKKDLPSIKIRSENNKIVQPERYRLIPIEFANLDNFFKARNSKLKQNNLDQLKASIKASGIETIPLWMDLIVDFVEVNPLNEIDEINLLAHWIEQVLKFSDNLDEVIRNIEFIAFNSFKKDESIITQQISRDYLKPEQFSEMKKYGWIVPFGNYKGEENYHFAHERLREYLASRHILSNWGELENELFDRESGLITNRYNNTLFDLAIKEGKRINIANEELTNMIYSIAGEDNWCSKNNQINYSKLRDPLLALKYCSTFQFEDSFWLQELKNLLKKTNKFYLNIEDSSNERKNMLSWLNKEDFLNSYIACFPEEYLLEKSIKSIEYEINNFRLEDSILDKLLEIMIGKGYTDYKTLEMFFRFVTYQHLNPFKWSQDALDYLIFVEQNTSLLLSEEDRETKSRYYFIIFHALEIVRKTAYSSYLNFILKWSESEESILRKIAFQDFRIDERLTSIQFRDLCKLWLRYDDEYIRELAVDLIYRNLALLDCNIDTFFSQELFEEDYVHWFNYSITEPYPKLYSNDPKSWLKENKDSLFRWACEQYSLYELITKLPLEKCPEIFIKIQSKHAGEKNIEEVRKIFGYLSSLETEVSKEFDDFIIKDIDLKKLQSEKNYQYYMLIHRKDLEFDTLLNYIELDNWNINSLVFSTLVEKDKNEAREYFRKILTEDKELSYQLWGYLLSNVEEFSAEFINIGLASRQPNIRYQILNSLNYKRNEIVCNRIENYVISENLIHNNKQVRILMAHLVEYLDEDKKKYALSIIADSKDSDLKSIGLRISFTHSGLSYYRAIYKFCNVQDCGLIRPLFNSSGIEIHQPESFVNYFYRIDDIYEDDVYPGVIYFGIERKYLKSYIKENYLKEIHSDIKVRTFGDILPLEDAIEFSYIYHNNHSKSLSESLKTEFIDSQLKVYKKILRSEDKDMILSILVYLDELFILNPVYFEIFSEDIVAIFNTHDVKLKNYSKFLFLRHSNIEKIMCFYEDHKDTINKQVLWWALGERNEKELENILIEDLKTWEICNIKEILQLVLPFTILTKSIFLEAWKLLIKYFEKYEPDSYRYAGLLNRNSLLIYLDWILVRSLGCGEGSYKPNQEKTITLGIEYIQKYVNPHFQISEEEIIAFIIELSESKSRYLFELGNEILLELGKINYKFFTSRIDNKTDNRTINLLLRHFDELDVEDKIVLTKLRFAMYEHDEGQHEYFAEKFSIIEESNIGILDILEFLLKKHDKSNLIFYGSPSYFTSLIWDKHVPELLKLDFSLVCGWLLDIAKQNITSSISFYKFPRILVKKLINFFSKKENYILEIYSKLFFAYYSKPYCATTYFWERILEKED